MKLKLLSLVVGSLFALPTAVNASILYRFSENILTTSGDTPDTSGGAVHIEGSFLGTLIDNQGNVHIENEFKVRVNGFELYPNDIATYVMGYDLSTFPDARITGSEFATMSLVGVEFNNIITGSFYNHYSSIGAIYPLYIGQTMVFDMYTISDPNYPAQTNPSNFMGWGRIGITDIAPSRTGIEIYTADYKAVDWHLWAVDSNSVPEPQSLALIGLGFSAMAWTARRRKYLAEKVNLI